MGGGEEVKCAGEERGREKCRNDGGKYIHKTHQHQHTPELVEVEKSAFDKFLLLLLEEVNLL